jgi:hypothetical protein
LSSFFRKNLFFIFQFEDETGLTGEHHYYEDDFASHDDFDYNSGRGFPQNFSVLFDVEDDTF